MNKIKFSPVSHVFIKLRVRKKYKTDTHLHFCLNLMREFLDIERKP